MRFVAVTACPTGIAHTLMAAEALKRQATLMGHQIDVETQGSEGTKQPLSGDDIARADAVILAADIFIDPARFAGKPVTASSTADAIRRPHDVLEEAAAAASELDVTLPEPPPPVPADHDLAPTGAEPPAARSGWSPSRPARPGSPTPSWPPRASQRAPRRWATGSRSRRRARSAPRTC